MRRTLRAVVGLAVIATACGSTSETAPGPGPIAVDESLAVSPVDHVYHTSLGEHPWSATAGPDGVRVRLRYLLGEEASNTIRLDLADDAGSPVLVEGTVARTWWDGEDHHDTSFLTSAQVTLREWNPGSVVSGRVHLETGPTIPFWVDLGRPVTDVADHADRVAVSPGGVIQYGCCTVLQFLDVLEDSRCPPDVQCVWEGRLRVTLLNHTTDRMLELSLPGDPVVYLEPGSGVVGRTVRLADATVGEAPTITLAFADLK